MLLQKLLRGLCTQVSKWLNWDDRNKIPFLGTGARVGAVPEVEEEEEVEGEGGGEGVGEEVGEGGGQTGLLK